MTHSVALKKTSITVRVNEDVKRNAETTLKKLGVSMSDVFNMLLNQINLKKGIPFDVKIPNKETAKAIREARAGKGLIESKSLDDLFTELDI